MLRPIRTTHTFLDEVAEAKIDYPGSQSPGTIQHTRSMRPASSSRAAAISGSSDLPPPGVTAARMSRAPVCPPPIA